jgi:hypothetical protein
MQEMSFWQVVVNSPEWVGVFASTLFAIVTISVVIWQVRVMVRQNKLIQLQHEHEWLVLSNEGREQVLNLARKLHHFAGYFEEKPKKSGQHFWENMQDTAYELRERLQTLDVSAYSGEYDNWFPRLTEYVDTLLIAVGNDYEFKTTYNVEGGIPSISTRDAIKGANEKYKPVQIVLDLQSAIRMEFLEFKDKWASAL